MVLQGVAAAVLLAGAVYAKTCQNITVPVTISARNGVFGGIKNPVTNLDATTFALNATRQGANGTALALTGYATVSGTYDLSVKYCVPATTGNSSVNASSSTNNLQILTHGIGFDKTYWDLSFNNYNYSYIDTALADGYSTISYDRLGIGNSSHGDPLNVIQSFLEVEALAALTNKLRNGSIPQIKKKFSKIIHVGHSFGSAQTYSLVAKYPTISDGIVLTGFSMNSSFVSVFTAGGGIEQAYLNQPLRFGNKTALAAVNMATEIYPALLDLLAPISISSLAQTPYAPGYVVSGNAGNVNYQFLFNGHFDPAILYLGDQTKQPFTPGEALTLSSLPMTNAYAGPVLVFTAQYDVPYCGGNCLATGNPALASIPAAVSKFFTKPKTFQAYIQPNTGHGINFHYNATAGYRYIQNWLKTQSL